MSEIEQRPGQEELEKELGYRFHDASLLTLALTHKSYANENLDVHDDNQRLEFLGDAVLGLVVAQALMEQLPDANEGELTPRRASLVRESSLVQLAHSIDLGLYLLLGKGEEKNEGRQRNSILADAVESVVGAVYLDGGYASAQKLVKNWLGDRLNEAVDGSVPGDAKTALQELLQSKNNEAPAYSVKGEEGPDHAKVFEVDITVGEVVIASGKGRSKKEAEKAAAKAALKVLEEECSTD